jgi:hypothetical protein
MKKKLFFSFVIINLFFLLSIKAQTTSGNKNLESSLARLSSRIGEAYISPIIPSFGSNLNSGWVSRVPEATKLGFYIDLKIIAMGSVFKDKPKTFSINDQFYFDDAQTKAILANSGITPSNPSYTLYYNQIYNQPNNVTMTGPTITGSKNQSILINYPGNTTLHINPYNVEMKDVSGFLEELPLFPTGAVQLTVGTIAGTHIAFRYCPPIEIDKDLGKFDYFGIGFIHNPGVWFKNSLPIDIGLGYFTQKMRIGTIFESKASQGGIYLSKTFGGVVSITPYAGLTMETSKTTVSYSFQSNQSINGVPVKPINISLELDGENSSSAVVGLTIHLAIINITGDYKFAKTKTFSVGVSFGM